MQKVLGGIGGWVFSDDLKPDHPMDRCAFNGLLRDAETKAGLPKLVGGLWHPYRRKWASERKHLPLKDVAAAGGWQDTNTLLRCYQQSDDETLRAVMNEPRKVTEIASTGI